MSRHITKQYGLLAFANAMAVAVMLAAIGSVSAQELRDKPAAAAPAVNLASTRLADLERAFWFCDYTATTQRAAAADITTCAAIYDALKERKFGGDFDRLWVWWQEHRAAQHSLLAAIAE